MVLIGVVLVVLIGVVLVGLPAAAAGHEEGSSETPGDTGNALSLSSKMERILTPSNLEQKEKQRIDTPRRPKMIPG